MRWAQRKLARGEPSAGAEVKMTEREAETEGSQETVEGSQSQETEGLQGTNDKEDDNSGGAALTRLVSVTVLCPAAIHGSVFLISFLSS